MQGGGYSVSPVFTYPEFGWSFNGETATATYNLGPQDNVTWTAGSDGTWHYEHTWGGFSVGAIINDVVSTLAIIADVSGFVFLGMFLNTAQAVANHEPLSELGKALQEDWAAMQNSAQLTYALIDGDWETAWNAATQYGQNLSGIQAAWAPGPAPDVNGNLTITASSTPSTSPWPVGVKPPAPSSSSSSASTATKAVAGGVVAAAAGFSLYAFATKQSLEQAAKRAWRSIQGE